MHWLWLLSKVYSGLRIPVGQDQLLRVLTITPVLLAHIGLLMVVNRLVSNTDDTDDTDDRRWHAAMGLAALNPALLMDGPVWGQVDLLFSVMLVCALALLISGRALLFVFPLLVTALLTKFQSICIAPVLLPLFWHRRRRALWLGLLPAGLIAVLLLLPYWRAGSILRMLDLTYLKASSLYPFATYNAHNLWCLIGLNTRSDELYVFTLLKPVADWQKLLTPKRFGMVLCAAWGLWLMISSWRTDSARLHWRNAFLAGLGFFLFLPAMHERYMVPAAVLACAAATSHSPYIFHAVALSLLSAVNMADVLRPSGPVLPQVFAALTLCLAIASLLPGALLRVLAQLGRLPLPVWLLVSAAAWGYAIYVPLQRLKATWVDATTLPGRGGSQSWGDLQIGGSVTQNALSVGKRQWRSGFGTHAASTITLPVPVNATKFSAKVGVDDEGRGAEVEFSVRIDGREIWKSGTMKVGDPARAVSVDVKGARHLDLIVDPLGSIQCDHADWLDPGFSLAPATTP